MIHMNVRQKEEIHILWFHGPGIHGNLNSLSLTNAAVYHNVQSLCPQQMTGSGNVMGCADVDNFIGHFDFPFCHSCESRNPFLLSVIPAKAGIHF
jgi:hypothetical protein